MQIHQGVNFSIYFGDQEESIACHEIFSQERTYNLELIADRLQVTQIALLLQNHGIEGVDIARHDNQSSLFSQPGDYLVTQRTYCGIGVVTADCVPIVLYDPITHTAAIIHAGWKGLLANIVQQAVYFMAEKMLVQREYLQMYIGPCALSCCYQVQQDFIDRFTEKFQDAASFFVKKEDKIYFDCIVCINVIARNLGIKQENIYTMYNVCTICTLSFCSYRRQKDKARRQVTMISLY